MARMNTPAPPESPFIGDDAHCTMYNARNVLRALAMAAGDYAGSGGDDYHQARAGEALILHGLADALHHRCTQNLDEAAELLRVGGAA